MWLRTQSSYPRIMLLSLLNVVVRYCTSWEPFVYVCEVRERSPNVQVSSWCSTCNSMSKWRKIPGSSFLLCSCSASQLPPVSSIKIKDWFHKSFLLKANLVTRYIILSIKFRSLFSMHGLCNYAIIDNDNKFKRIMHAPVQVLQSRTFGIPN